MRHQLASFVHRSMWCKFEVSQYWICMNVWMSKWKSKESILIKSILMFTTVFHPISVSGVFVGHGMLYIFWKVWPRAIHLTKNIPTAYNTHLPAYLPIYLFWLLSCDLWERKKVRATVCLLVICLGVLRPLFCHNCHMLVVADYSSPERKHVMNMDR